MTKAACGLTTCWPVTGLLPGAGQTAFPSASLTVRMNVRGISTPPLAIAP